MRRLIWTAYAVMVAEGFLVYAVGFITPLVRDTLHVEPWLAASPNSLMAVGLGLGGVVARRLNARLGAERAIRAWLLVMALSAVLLAAPVSILAPWPAASSSGAALGAWLVHVNSALGRAPRGGLTLTRANLASVAGGLAGPIAPSIAATTIGWWTALHEASASRGDGPGDPGFTGAGRTGRDRCRRAAGSGPGRCVPRR